MLRGKGRKKRKDRQSQIQVDKDDLHTLKINCKGKRTAGKGTKGINVEKNNNRLKKLKIKKDKGRLKKKKKKRKTPQNCKSPTQKQRFIIIKNVTEEKKEKLKSLTGFPIASPTNTPIFPLLTLWFFPLVSSSYRVLHGSIYSFPLVRYSCWL